MEKYIDEAIEAWIAAKEAISDSGETKKKYSETIAAFRSWLLTRKNRDIDLAMWADSANKTAWRRAKATFLSEAQQFAEHSKKSEAKVSAATRKQRIAILSSFYAFATNEGFFEEYVNPLAGIKRPKAKTYGKVRPLDTKVIAAAMQSIDRSTAWGLRDYAVLTVLLLTAERKNAVGSLRWGDVELLGSLSQITAPQELRIALNFRRTKGGKSARHVLTPAGSFAVLECVAAAYDMNPLYLDAERGLWVSFSRRVPPGTQLNAKSIAGITYRHLGTTHVHRLRHTVAQAFLQLGMPLPDIQARLGHEHLSTTALYLEALEQGQNEAPASFDELFGISVRGIFDVTFVTRGILPEFTEPV